MKWETAEQMREKLRQEVSKAGTQTKFAKQSNVSVAYVNDCLQGRREIGRAIARALGYVPMTIYRPVDNPTD